MSQAAIGLPGSESRPGATARIRALRRLLVGLAVGAALATVWIEARESRLQATLFHDAAVAMQPGSGVPSHSASPGAATAGVLAPTRPGPYDERLGYAELPRFAARARTHGYRIEIAARPTPALRAARAFGLAPPYAEKAQAGLRIEDRHGQPLFETRDPLEVYRRFEEIPEPVVTALLFVENRELLDARHPTRNPVLEWDRLARAAFAYPQRLFEGDGHPIGGSTLATQIEKFRHSPGGRTDGPLEKLRQIVAASLSVYRQGPETADARRRVVLDYLNGVPLAALPGHGEVFGLGDGLRLWMGADFERTNTLLRRDDGDPEIAAERGRAFRQVLALILAAQRPSDFLRGDSDALARRTGSYLKLMADGGALPAPLLRAAVAAGPVVPRRRAAVDPPPADRKLAAPARVELAKLIGVDSGYELDRLDLTAETTLEAPAQHAVDALLDALQRPAAVHRLGLVAPRLLDEGDPGAVQYAVTLYERTGGAALLRVQTDTWPGDFDPSDGARLDLGSTAKLRTVVSYLQAVAQDYRAFAGRSPEVLRAYRLDPSDAIGRFVVDRLIARPGAALDSVLEAALERRYPASPAETFFTGGGRQRFRNFDSDDDRRVLSVREAFQRSVNLVFVRLMRDVANHYAVAAVGDPTRLVADASDPRRDAWLDRFAAHDGRLYLERFDRQYRGVAPGEAMALLVPPRRRTPERLAAVLRLLEPDATPTELAAHLRAEGFPVSDASAERLHARYAPDRMGLTERAWVARVHPLALWTAAWLRAHPDASFGELLAASGEAREEAYAWLHRTRRKDVADRAIRSAIEREAFARLGRSWRRLGYPFPDVVPSLATAIGSSGDRPSSLAELVGILLADGVREPDRRIEKLRFGEATPWKTVLVADPPAGEHVLEPEIARAVRGLMVGTVEHGTARRVAGALRDAEGRSVAIGGKTGTGDHRWVKVGAHGEILDSRSRARTATFAFFIGDRFYGVVTAFVEGPESADYDFTSSLPVEIVRLLAPSLDEWMPAPGAPDPEATRVAAHEPG